MGQPGSVPGSGSEVLGSGSGVVPGSGSAEPLSVGSGSAEPLSVGSGLPGSVEVLGSGEAEPVSESSNVVLNDAQTYVTTINDPGSAAPDAGRLLSQYWHSAAQ
ncbi:hypothetical protein LRD69_30220 [Streptomyces sp. JH14]|uniref:hypothetical protein n=1 Tax=Streptomyces sp. JH14 TaxID=2793630 RepID=UPI0023F9894D|nr:hypothetical protein [Streptomyces sp. JH14]MDF6046327.1 hypothetical protein [Streptomyces sp. JH14]